MKASDLFAGGVWCQACLPAVPYGRGHSQPGSLFIHFGAISVLPDADWAPLNTACASFPSDSRIVQVLANGATASVTEDAERPLGMGHLLRRRRYQQQMITSGDKFDTCPLGSTPVPLPANWQGLFAFMPRRPPGSPEDETFLDVRLEYVRHLGACRPEELVRRGRCARGRRVRVVRAGKWSARC